MTTQISYDLSDYNLMLESEVYYKNEKMFWITFSFEDITEWVEEKDKESLNTGDWIQVVPDSRLKKILRIKDSQDIILDWGLESINCLEMHTSEEDIEFCYKQNFNRVRMKYKSSGWIHMKFYHD